MNSKIMKKRIASLFAAAVVTASCTGGAVTGTVSPLSLSAMHISYAAESTVNVIEYSGYEEGLYAKWSAVSGADGYNVYVDGTQIDSMLIRQYASYMRADMVGVMSGEHTMKIVPVIGGKEDTSKSAEIKAVSKAHDRSGFAFVNGTASGAYNDDGTLRTNAVVLYVTENTKDKVSMDVQTDSKGTKTSCTGIQNILTAYQKGYEPRPLDIRFVGAVTDPAVLTAGDLLIKGNGDTKRLSCGITVEGIGDDAAIIGFGIRLANCSNVEVRNIGVMLVDSDEGDNVTLQQSCDHIWVHHFDSFYGMPGGDADQAKGDGALDCKKSTYVTFSYNHFYDNGKCNLLGLSEGTNSGLYITYHHNWYDHSDSRHPRVRFYSAHIYNNYYDGNSKYGIGSTNASSVFSENNYFRNCKYPMLTSMQGSDTKYSDGGKGTFSSEDGGVIKAYGNIIEGGKAFTPYSENNTEYDAYVVANRTDKIPSSIQPKQTSKLALDHTYNNFDTSADMYKYPVDKAEDVPSIVTANAGRLNGGDFKWTFTAQDDESYSVNQELMSALKGYKSQVIAIGSGFKSDVSAPVTTTSAATTKASATTVTTTAQQTSVTTTAKVTTPDTVTDGDIFVSPTGKGNGKTANDPTDIYTAVKNLTAGHTIYLLGGKYSLAQQILIEDTNNGTANAMKTIKPYNNAEVVFDFTAEGAANNNVRGIVLDGDYWHLYGFEITKAADNGMLLGGSNNIIEMMVFNDNQDTGLQISRYKSTNTTIDTWPSYNLILNCTSKNNCDDATMENADGFAAKLTCGEGNVFDGCMAYNNSDDGWDLFAKTETGPIGVVTIKNSVAFRNGFTEFGEGYGECDGNGFKLGGSGVGSAHNVINCLAFENLHCGFTDNNNPKLGSLTNCTAFNNNMEGKGKPNFSLYRCTDDGCDFKNMMSVYDASVALSDSRLKAAASNDKYVGTYENGVYYNSAYYEIGAKVTAENGMKLGTKLSAAPSKTEFISYAKAPVQGTDFHKAWRNADGTIKTGGLYETASNSKYASMGAHFANGTVNVTTTSTTQKPVTTTTTTVTATVAPTATTSSKPSVSGGYVHDFTANGADSSFYTISGNLSTSKGTVEYNGKTLTQCLKLETATNIKFNAPSNGKLTLVFAETAPTIKVDGTKYTGTTNVIELDLTAGAHEITKADTANLFYMVYAESGSSAVTTTTAETENYSAGDANCDGEVNMADAVLIMQAMANPDKYGIGGTSENAITKQGFINADVYNKGDGVSTADALSIQKYMLKLIEVLPEK